MISAHTLLFDMVLGATRRAIEPESLLPLRKAIGQYLESKVITSPRGKLIVGRALVGRTIYHQSTSP